MKTIIVPTDFSPIATNAMNFAADMALNINASLMLLHIYQVPVSMTDVPVVLVSAEELRKSSEAKLQEIKSSARTIFKPCGLASAISGKIAVLALTEVTSLKPFDSGPVWEGKLAGNFDSGELPVSVFVKPLVAKLE